MGPVERREKEKEDRKMELNSDFYEACGEGNLKQVKLLLKKGADINYTNCHMGSVTPFMVACQRGHKKIVKLLISVGVNVHARDDKQCSAAAYACKYGKLSIVKILVREGLSFTFEDRSGYSPLHVASMYGYWRIVKYLSKRGKNNFPRMTPAINDSILKFYSDNFIYVSIAATLFFAFFVICVISLLAIIFVENVF